MKKWPSSSLILREYGSSGEDVSVNAVIIPKNWWVLLPNSEEWWPHSPIHLTQNYCIHIVGKWKPAFLIWWKITYWFFWGVFSTKIWTLVLKTPQKHQYVMVLVFRGVFSTKIQFLLLKTPPCIAIVQFLLMKCPQQIRKYIVDTTLVFTC